MQHDENSTIDDNEFVSDSDYAMNAIEIDETISYKCGCSFEDSESEAHVYDSSRIGSNIFRKAELMSIHLSQLMLQHRISRAAYRDIVQFNLGLRSATVKLLMLCLSPSQVSRAMSMMSVLVVANCMGLMTIKNLVLTAANRDTKLIQSKLMSVGNMFSQMLADPATRELLHYRANPESVAGQLTNVFDGDSYKQLMQQNLFSNPDGIAIELYTNGFVNQKKGKSLYTIVHAVVFNLDPSIR
ncbi:hypothetical protein PHYBLDRAFT_176215 [Phycomyces blakesleeanus NRRL 1555(-)]|uniref:Uncharacterized protein n=1 Tax=Phycomyces blakesleeanus (strain ATCC 8743b / DSM 1359 / FGSC 10004 / NBRC 33097 / NRRL 1555) TaxID=763407 RepID=A0A167J6M1_PHYB8|nr:hypothetical protein PHYBLDRAFT_176215 [Phycomyces blakesleeanus NRRL 1555(-)]OAD65297.1 hypothetical protein PHYBLDRAFT_176215 [Phycomyces blakesleeanus NRRL 1555(-)]|eukprot:XP_018283337.1 hypothetical protein PHYBLDRAFT_176215 [Phycomyces blakesleeanus NRRL 1555(-)]